MRFGKIVRASAIALGLLLTSISAWGLGNEILPPGVITPIGDVLAKVGVKILVRVASNAELKVYRYGGTVVRDGFLASGDGGAATYTHSSAPCSLNAGAGDDGAQVRDARGTGCWNADLSKPIPAAVWGVNPNAVLSDDEPAWVAAITALGTLNNGGTLIMPSRYDVSHLISGSSTCSRLNRTLTIGVSNIRIIGSGAWGSCFTLNFPTGNGIEIGGNPLAPTPRSVFNVSIEHIGFFNSVPRTSGANVSVYQSQFTKLDYIECKGPNYWICVDIDGHEDGRSDNLDTSVSNLWAAYGGQTGIRIGCMGAKYSPTNTILNHLELDNHNGSAEEICQAGAILQTGINTDFNYHGFWAHPTGQQHISGIFSDKTSYDASAREGFLVDTTGGGYFHENKFHSLWVGGSGTEISRSQPGWAPSRGMSLIGGARLNTIIANTFDVLVLAAGQDCLVMDGGVIDAELSGVMTGCSQSAVGRFHGLFSAGATHWSWRGRIGSYNGAIDGKGNNVLPNYQDYGVYVTDAFANARGVQTGDYFTISGDLSRNRAGPIFNNAHGTNFSFDGVLPALPWIATTPTVRCASGSLGTPRNGASRAMRYQIVGKTVRYNFDYTAGSDGTCKISSYSIPFAAASPAVATGSEFSPSGKALQSRISANSSTALLEFYDNRDVGAVNAIEVISGQYERQ